MLLVPFFTVQICLAGLPVASFVCLVQFVNSAALVDWWPVSTITVMKHLHWLPVSKRIHFKMLMYAFKALHQHMWANCWTSIDLNATGRFANSATLLCVPSTKNNLGDLSYSSAAPHLGNALPQFIREADTKNGFKRLLKTHLFGPFYSWLLTLHLTFTS